MKRIDLPTSEKVVRSLKVGDEISLNGLIVTARDAVHKMMVEKWPTYVEGILKDGVIFHCGPIMKKTKMRFS